MDDPVSNENSIRYCEKSVISDMGNLKDTSIWENNKKNLDDSLKFEQKVNEIKEEKRVKSNFLSMDCKNFFKPGLNYDKYEDGNMVIEEDGDDVDECSSLTEEKLRSLKRNENGNKNNLTNINSKNNTLNSNQNKMRCFTSPDDFFQDQNFKKNLYSNSENINNFFECNQVNRNDIAQANLMKNFAAFGLDDRKMNINTSSTIFTTNESNESFFEDDYRLNSGRGNNMNLNYNQNNIGNYFNNINNHHFPPNMVNSNASQCINQTFNQNQDFTVTPRYFNNQIQPQPQVQQNINNPNLIPQNNFIQPNYNQGLGNKVRAMSFNFNAE
jgi:hypothetical protein